MHFMKFQKTTKEMMRARCKLALRQAAMFSSGSIPRRRRLAARLLEEDLAAWVAWEAWVLSWLSTRSQKDHTSPTKLKLPQM